MRTLRILVGLAVCAAGATAPWCLLERPAAATLAPSAPLAAPGLAAYWTAPRQHVLLEFDAPTDVALGDGVFVLERSAGLQQVGEVVALSAGGRSLPVRQADVLEARVVLYPGAPPLSPSSRIVYRTNPHSLEWIVSTLLPGDRQAAITAEIEQALRQHRDELAAVFDPLIQRSLQEVSTVIEEDGPAALQRHRPEIDALAARYEQEIVRGELLPLVKSEIWPIVREKAEPKVREVGRQLWSEVSLWRFSWRLLYDKAPLLPERHLVEREWNRFLEQKALPILESHADEFIAVVKEILAEVSRNERVRETARRSLQHIASDPEAQNLARVLWREVVADNAHVHQALERTWTSPEARQAMTLAGQRLEPTVRRIIDLVFGSPSEGITPQFAQVLRSQVLAKDRRWFLLEAVPSAGRTAPDSLRVAFP